MFSIVYSGSALPFVIAVAKICKEQPPAPEGDGLMRPPLSGPAQELIFIFVAPDQESVKKLIGGTVVKLDLAISRCRSKAEDVSTE